MSEILENPMYNPMIKVDRILNAGNELRRLLIEMEECEILKKERLKNKIARLSKKLVATTNLLEDETELNNSLIKEVKQLKNRLKVDHATHKMLKEDYDKVVEQRDRLLEYKNKKRKAFSQWLHKRLRRRKKYAIT